MTDNYDVKNYIILDIETTGLSAKNTEVILVGIIHHKNDNWFITQIFCDEPYEESQLLLKLITYIHSNHIIITYNGHAFDLPYLNKRLMHHGIDFEFSLIKHFDLYRVVRASKKALNLDNYKLKSIENYLGIERQDLISGKESVELYLKYVESQDLKLRETILLHNYDDIKYMIPTLKILDYIPNEITERYYPFSFETEEFGCLYLNDYILKPSSLTISLAFDKQLQKSFHYFANYSFVIDEIIKISVPIFTIGNRHFIDIDLLDFCNKRFNDLDLDEQLKYELQNKLSTVHTVLKLFKEL